MFTIPLHVESVLDTDSWALAGEYAHALMSAVRDAGDPDATREELGAVAAVLDASPEGSELLGGQTLGRADRLEAVGRVFGGRVSRAVEALLAVLARHGKMGLLPLIARRFEKLSREREGKVEVAVTTARPLDEAQREDLARSLAGTLNIQPVLRCYVDGRVLGGVVVQIADRVYDASLAARVRKLRRHLHDRLRVRWTDAAAPETDTETP